MCPSAPILRQNSLDDPEGSTGITPVDLGTRIRSLRQNEGWSLDEASERAGISRSSLFKIEKGQMSPTFDAMQKIARGFGMDISHLVVSPSKGVGAGRRSVTRADEGTVYEVPHYRHTLLCADLANKSFIPFKSVVSARSLDDFEDWDRHDSEDFMYVLSGSIILYTEFYEPLALDSGDSVYYDGRMGHACVCQSEDDAVMLWISSG